MNYRSMKHKFMKRGLDKFFFFLTLFFTLTIIHGHLAYENRAQFRSGSFYAYFPRSSILCCFRIA